MQEKTDSHLPIYVSYSTFTTFLDWLAEMPVIPTQLDRSLWCSKFAGGTGSQLMGGLRFLRLLDEEKPTERLEPLVRADATHRKQLMMDLIRDAYGSQLVDSLSGMTPKMLNERLQTLGATESTLRKAFSFIVNAAKANDIPIAPSIAKKARNKQPGRKPANAKRPKDSSTRRPDKPESDKPEVSKPQPNIRVVDLRSGGKVTVALSVDLFALSVDDTAFVIGLIEKLRSYETAHQQPAEAADGNNEEAPGLQSSAAAPGAPERSI